MIYANFKWRGVFFPKNICAIQDPLYVEAATESQFWNRGVGYGEGPSVKIERAHLDFTLIQPKYREGPGPPTPKGDGVL